MTLIFTVVALATLMAIVFEFIDYNSNYFKMKTPDLTPYTAIIVKNAKGEIEDRINIASVELKGQNIIITEKPE